MMLPNIAFEHGLGLGESIGKMIHDNPEEFPYGDISVLEPATASAFRSPSMLASGKISFTNTLTLMELLTVRSSYRDFLTFVR